MKPPARKMLENVLECYACKMNNFVLKVPATVNEEGRTRAVPGIREQRQREAEKRAETLRREHLTREIQLGALNTRRYRALWREVMMRIKMPRIVEDVEVAWRNFERALDSKDYRISFLMDELDEAEEQYQRNARSHAETIDRLLRMYADRTDREERSYRRVLNDSLDRRDNEVDEIRRRQDQAEILLHAITRGVQRQSEESLDNFKSITLSKIDAFVEDSKDIRRISATQLENQLQSSWNDLRRVLSDYQNRTEDRRKYYEALREKDELDRQAIARQFVRMANLFEETRRLRSKIAAYDAAARKDISEISTEHDFFQKAYRTVKNRFLSEQTKDKDQLRTLSVEYNKTVKHLERLVTKGKRLLTLMEICRKYESHDEKVFLVTDCTRLEELPFLSLDRVSVPPEWDVSRQVNLTLETRA
ncbi:dynein regulatory complex subunit 2 [Ooceraea biroi]|uniref:dynein regulatory complex subunit 2 n=1 Tax=Ooceraea biroi TaxID=2015173 RepID=UPI000F074D6E|nr:dynein regulatory complex subunit 2 [Ooceraea biroi]